MDVFTRMKNKAVPCIDTHNMRNSNGRERKYKPEEYRRESLIIVKIEYDKLFYYLVNKIYLH